MAKQGGDDCFGEIVLMFGMHLLDIVGLYHANISSKNEYNVLNILSVYIPGPSSAKFIRFGVPFGKPGVFTPSSVYMHIPIYTCIIQMCSGSIYDIKEHLQWFF